MAEFRVNRPTVRRPTHPGELMREILEEQIQVPAADAAARMKVSSQELMTVLNGTEPVTADLALRFSRLTGGTPELYLQMQAQYDLWTAREQLRDTLQQIEPVA